MSTLEPKSVKTRLLNPKLLPIAAVVLIVLALLFMATPLMRQARAFQGGGNFVLRSNGQSVPQNGFPAQGGPNLPARSFALGGNLLGGILGPIIYFVALLVSLAAALGMFFTKRWGQVMGIIMAILYSLLGLLSLLPILLMSFMGTRNPLSLILGVVHVLLAIAVIVLASIPAKKSLSPVIAIPPPAAGA